MRIRILLSAACLWFSANLFAQHCELPVSIVLDEEFTDVPAAASSMLYQSLSRMATENGLTTEAPNSPFVLTAHCDVLDKSNLPGAPIQTVYNLRLTVYMVDTYQQKKFAFKK